MANTPQFSNVPTIEGKRSTFNRDSTHKTTFNAGKLVPIYVDEVLPGDTFNINIANIIRSMTPYNPVMDNAYLDLHAFFVPNRLVWDHWEEFMGANKTDKWTQKTKMTIPLLETRGANIGQFRTNGVADHMGLPINVPNLKVNHLPFRAYCLIWNEFFRDQNLQDPVLIDKGSATTAVIQGSNPWQTAITGDTLLPVNKYHDYFTSALPESQKGAVVPIFGEDGWLPVATRAKQATNSEIREELGGTVPMRWEDSRGNLHPMPEYTNYDINAKKLYGVNYSETQGVPSSVGPNAIPLAPANLWAYNLNGANDINSLRLQFQIQKALEKDARGGTRYTEMIETHYGVTNPDARLQRPEFLGGHHIPLQQQQIAQTSGTPTTPSIDTGDGKTPQGNLAAYSLTSNEGNIAMKSFTEHGHIIILASVRTDHTYQQGIDKMWSRKERFDYYHPVFANLGEQPIKAKEIFAKGDLADEGTFGFQEAWAEYRYKPSKVSGMFNSSVKGSLDVWHYADNFADHQVLNSDFIQEKPDNIDRTLVFDSKTVNQFMADFYIQNKTTRPMPINSIPGLIDHN